MYERDRFFASNCDKSEVEDVVFTRLLIFKKEGVFWIYCNCAITAYIFFRNAVCPHCLEQYW